MIPHDVVEDDFATFGSSNPSEDIVPKDSNSKDRLDLTDKDFRQDLQDCLDDMKHQGTFSSVTTTGLYINPGLRIKQVGLIGLPLTERDAGAVAGVCRQAPFGKGDETLVDESVRKTWELDATEFTCCNPAWSEYINKLAEHAMQGLGVEAPSHAEAYKLLLYAEGAFFKAHRDTEKVPGMFGTLVICLPSEHTGGEVRLNHGGKEKIIETAPTSAFDLCVLAWYSDVQHEIKPVTSGYRLVLTYNLVQDQSFPRQSATTLDTTANKLERLLRIWQTQFSHHESFIYPLQHRYTEVSLSLRHLKGEDAAKCRYIEQICKKNDIYWFLSHMTKETQEDYYEDDIETDISFCQTYTPLGKPINLNLLFINDDQILANVDELYGRGADSEDEGEFTGNENMPSTCRYHNTVAVMMRRDVAIARFEKQAHNPASLMAMFELIRDDEHCREDQQRTAMQILLQKSIEMITYKEGHANRQNYLIFTLLGYGTEREEKRAQYAKVFHAVSEFCYAKGLGDIVAAKFRAAMQTNSWHKNKELVGLISDYVAKETTEGKKDAWSSWLSVPMPTVTTYEFTSERLKILDTVEKILPQSSAAPFDGWKRAQLDTYLDAVTSFAQQDVQAVLELIPVVGKRVFFDTFIPKMVNKPDAAGLARFLRLLSQDAEKNDTLGDFERQTYQKLVPALKEVYRLSPNNLATRAYHYPGSYQREPPTLTPAANEFIDLIHRCQTVLQLRDEAQSLFVSSLPKLPTSDPTFWANWRSLLVFIEAIMKLLHPEPDTLIYNTASSFITEAVQGLATHLATSRPQEPRNWSRPNTQRDKCDCGPCADVKKFLLDPEQKTGRFSYAAQTRKHLQYTLDYHDFKFDTEKSRSPHTLVIHKTKNEYGRKQREWDEDVRQFKHQLAGLRSVLMTELLGGDIVLKSGIDEALEAHGAGGRALQPASASVQNVGAVAGSKRKSDVIDLTEDDPRPSKARYPTGPFIC
ncbi:hypothetical protein DE146DRAFT_697405 [Phaeosphaeria sp. MPI-PUGE-AT-0046c]|nr:hypothetical protein DE146DRAFT_697405 [Phaeosphaeria sp. MPI-PUGE-AT-0046c]